MIFQGWSVGSVLAAILVLAPGSLVMTGCSSDTAGNAGGSAEPVPTPIPLGDVPEKAALNAATPSANVASTELSLTAYAWRNDMPVAVEPGQAAPGLMVSTKVAAKGGAAVPSGTTLGKLFVIHVGDVWAAEFAKGAQGTFEATTRGGPLWAAGDKVDVIVRLDASDGSVAYVAHRGVAIESAQ